MLVSSAIAHEETFRTVMIIIRPKDEDEALKKSQAVEVPPGVLRLFRELLWDLARREDARMRRGHSERMPNSRVGYFPVGGIKDSGMGREGIGYSIDEMTNLKTIMMFNSEAGALGKREQAATLCKTGVARKAINEPDIG